MQGLQVIAEAMFAVKLTKAIGDSESVKLYTASYAFYWQMAAGRTRYCPTF